MSIFWRLADVLKRQKVSFLVCVLSLTVQWCHHSLAETMDPLSDARTNISGTPAITIPLDSASTPTPEDINTFAPKNSFHNYSIVEFITHTVESEIISGHGSVAESSPGHYEQRGEKSKSKQPVVLIAVLVTGIAAAAVMLGGYYHKSKKNKAPPSKRLDEEADAQDHDIIRFPVTSGDKPEAHDQPKVVDGQQNGEQVKATAGAEQKEDKKAKEEGDTEL
ncbi:uncharacterized protein [Narcine bancroftii]|uniref:uncharacterized protein n=1 Tax=Narcine bancroftii TaxID=1343680 RepID=UPI003831BE31